MESFIALWHDHSEHLISAALVTAAIYMINVTETDLLPDVFMTVFGIDWLSKHILHIRKNKPPIQNVKDIHDGNESAY